LSKLGYQIILLGRNPHKLYKAAGAIQSRDRAAEIEFVVCDLSILQSVRTAAEHIKSRHSRIDVLVNNAGGRFLRHQLTKDGFELTLATNHLGPFALTLLILPLLQNSQRPRIINVSSGTHFGANRVIENIATSDDYDGRAQYAESKLANILFTYSLARKLANRGICVNAVNPGGVATNFARNNGVLPWLRHRTSYFIKGQLKSPAEGSDTIIYLASSDDVQGVTGRFFIDRTAKPSSESSYNEAFQEQLWTSSVLWSGIDISN